jgi:GTPase
VSYTIAIIGRPNVGKSTLFNRLTGNRKAIVDDFSGVTRDRLYGTSEWIGTEFNLIDTGGFVQHSDDVFESAIREQVDIAIAEADLLIFMVDVTTGITDLDDQIAKKLRKSGKEVLLAVNKVDNSARQLMATEFYGLGLEHTFFISSITGSGSGELLDKAIDILKSLKPEIPVPEEEEIPRLAIIGQPNVGKSSLVNALLGEQRNIVTDIAGTTRDSINTMYDYYNKKFILIDTAGIRKKSKVNENLEFYTVIRAIKAIDDADVCLLLIDATLGIENQDLKILQVAEKKSKGIVVLVNKWDLVEKDHMTSEGFKTALLEKLAPMTDLPIIFISAITKQRIFKAMEMAIQVYENRKRKTQTSKLNEIMLRMIEKYPPPSVKGKYIKIKYVSQLPKHYPAFAFFCNLPQYIREPYRNYLENRLREHFDFHGVPIKIYFRKK